MNESEGTALSEILEDCQAPKTKSPKPRRPSFTYFGIRYSQWGREYKSYCYVCEYESNYGTRGKAVKSAIAHVTAAHELDGGETLR